MSNTHKRDITELRRTVSRRNGATRYPPRASRELIESCCRNGPPIPDDIPEARSIFETAQTAAELEPKSLASIIGRRRIIPPLPAPRCGRASVSLSSLSMNRYYLSYIFGETPGAVCLSLCPLYDPGLETRIILFPNSLSLSLSLSLLAHRF